MDSIVYGVFCALALPFTFGLAIGWALRGRRQRANEGSDASHERRGQQAHSRNQWLVKELDRAPLSALLTR